MQKTTTRLLAAAIALSWSGVANAQGTFIVPETDDRTTRVGTRGANFLEVGIGARAQGLGGAAMGIVDGPSSLFWNPANIANREGINAFASYMRLFGNSGITDMAGALSLGFGQGAIGVSVQTYSSGDILRTTEVAPQGGDPSYPGTFAYRGTAVGAHYARNITDRLAASVGARYVTEGIDFAKSSYFGVDIATRFRTGLYGLTVAASLQNVRSTGAFNGPGIERNILNPRDNDQPTGRDIEVEFRTRDAQLPTMFTVGVLSSLLGDAEALFGSNATHSLQAEVDFSDAIDTDLRTLIGVEYSFRRIVFARAGKRFFNEQHAPWTFADGLSFGGGLRVPALGRQISLDYAFVNMGELRNNQVFSFEFGF